MLLLSLPGVLLEAWVFLIDLAKEAQIEDLVRRGVIAGQLEDLDVLGHQRI